MVNGRQCRLLPCRLHCVPFEVVKLSKVPGKFVADNILFFFFFRENKLTFHVNHCLADESQEISRLIFIEKLKQKKKCHLLQYCCNLRFQG